MEQEIILPIPPFERRETFTRGGKTYISVHGINEQGFGFVYIEDKELDDEFKLVVRWVPIKMSCEFDEYGAGKPVITEWRKVFVSNNKVVKVDPDRKVMRTNHPDMISFTAGLGNSMIPSIINGKIRAIDGYDSMPVYASTGTRIPDVVYNEDGSINTEKSYDVNAAPTFTYLTHLPQYVSGSTESTSGSTESTSGSTEPTSGSTESTSGSTESTSGSTEPTSGSTEPTSGSTEPV
jgi:hypothetical protein